jgi:hypothetical protein
VFETETGPTYYFFSIIVVAIIILASIWSKKNGSREKTKLKLEDKSGAHSG